MTGIWIMRLPNWFVLDYLKRTNKKFPDDRTSPLHNCLDLSNDLTEVGTKLDLRDIMNKASKNKDQKLASTGSDRFNQGRNSESISGVIVKACFGQCGFKRDKPLKSSLILMIQTPLHPDPTLNAKL